MNKLNFQILEFTGEDSDYPVSELLIHTAQSKGWLSPRFCEYPQELTIQFFAPVRIRHIQFLSHESRISSRIDLFVSLPEFNQPLSNTEGKYNKLGFLTFDSNERSAFQARELKSVYVDTPCLTMKILMHKCHSNKHNMFNQIGLILLNFYGEPLSGFLTDPMTMDAKYDMVDYSSVFTQMTLDRLKELEMAKQKAIRYEDFEEARILKDEISRIKTIGDQLRILEEKKLICIQNEDFINAKLIKAEIDHLRALLNAPMERDFMQEIRETEEALDQQQQHPPKPKSLKGNDYDTAPNMMEEEKEEASSQEAFFATEPKPKNSPPPSDYNKKPSPPRAKVVNPDDLVIPTLRNKKDANNTSINEGDVAPPVDEAADIDHGPKIAENFTEDNHKLADPLIPFLGEDVCKKIIFERVDAT
jgi:centrosomal protein CEP104